MRKGIIILAAGNGTKMFPYATVRSKTTLNIAGKPLICYNAEIAQELDCKEIVVVTTSERLREIKASLFGLSNIEYICDDSDLGSANSLEKGIEKLSDTKNFTVVYGDTIIEKSDFKKLYEADTNAVLLKPLTETSRNWIGAAVENEEVSLVGAHYRGDSITHQFAGFNFTDEMITYIANTPDYFPNVKVGVGVPRERYVEAGLLKALEHVKVKAIECENYFFDIDKPWQMLEANAFMIRIRCASLTGNILMENAKISDKATIKGFVKLGKNSYIGDRVVVEGNLIAGDNCVIDNGAMFMGSAVVGNHTKISNYSQIYDGSSIGDHCILDHCAEFLGGMIMDKVYLYHYGEFFGAIGSYTDIGAATVCGTLRFDDGETEQTVKGRKETPRHFGNASYIGDYCRTGVNVVIMPGCKIGSYSVIGPTVMVTKDVPERTMVLNKQELITKEWDSAQYGW